ncbi:MAG TPA: gas vesicle protein [Propionibacteriaceae bacterium]|nr:gas vesicle protein [Propionibacteriaceae bacterium]
MAQPLRSSAPANLADILERVLDKGIVIAGDIRVNLLDIELLTIKIRLLVASVDKAQEMGIDWWRNDPMLSTSAQGLAEENRRLRERLEALELESGNVSSDEETEEDTEGETEVRAGVPDR